ncbi:hypothetical protein HK104_009423 [Borealophlyctis nickersoniae]|nr:hypothetical protein HK104_009423 [Borealophlyctis nickersoniae]
MTSPTPRGSHPIGAGCSAGRGCKGPCDSPRNESLFNQQWVTPKTYGRGETVPIEWIRANHPGGFVRLAIAPEVDSDDEMAFHNALGSQFLCYERGCGPTDPNDNYFGQNNGKGEGTCSGFLTIPTHLPDGKYTIQWIWFGGGVYMGQRDGGFGEYYACTDVNVLGGAAQEPDARPSVHFAGKDYSNPSENVCKYWSSNRVGDCAFKDQTPSCMNDETKSQWDACKSLEPCTVGPAKVGEPFMGSVGTGTTGSTALFGLPASKGVARRSVRRNQ